MTVIVRPTLMSGHYAKLDGAPLAVPMEGCRPGKAALLLHLNECGFKKGVSAR